MNHLMGISTLKLTCLIMQQNHISKIFRYICWSSSFALKLNLASLKTEVYKLDIDKLVPVCIDLSKLSDC